MKNKRIMFIVLVGMMSALVFASNYISIPIPVAIGSATRIHFGNAFCLLAGLLLGPLGGALSAGIGSAFYDLTNPAYIASAPFTFVFKFAMAFVAGWFMKKSGNPKSFLSILGAVLGQLLYIALYLSKTYIEGILEGSAPEAMFPVIVTKFGVSITNAVIAVIIATILSVTLQYALKKSKIVLT